MNFLTQIQLRGDVLNKGALFLLAKLRETLNDPRGIKLFDLDFYERCLKFCDALEKRLREENQSSGK